MLLRLCLKDFVIVDQLELEFSGGFSALTGETGAGKSILLDALSLALGERADPAFIRDGCTRAEVSAEFAAGAAVEQWLGDKALFGDEGLVLVRRVLDSEGKSRAFINGSPVTIATLRELGEQLLEIHGQHASQALLKPSGQRLLLDRYAGSDVANGELAQVRLAFRELQRLQQARLEAEQDERAVTLQREALLWQLSELKELKPEAGEWERLSEEQKRLANAKALIEGAQHVADAMLQGEGQGDAPLLDRLGHMAQRLSQLCALDPSLRESLNLLESAHIQLEEAASGLSHYAERLDLDPQRLQDTEHRVSALFASARKLKLAPENLPQHWQALEERLSRLDESQDLAKLAQKIALAQSHYDLKARALSKVRHAAAKTLTDGVSKLLPSLGMKGASLGVQWSAQAASEFGSDGLEFLFAGHASTQPRSLIKVASGGELSRVCLAIAVLAAEANPVPSLIFDEADAGIGGGVASVVGKLMRQLGQDRQVFCVTHLPQVAALANHHYRVSKMTNAGVTLSQVTMLDRTLRVDEIARMLGGEEITASTRKLARELLG
jgi:DNA repair protein RecN (Recombination protein N)